MAECLAIAKRYRFKSLLLALLYEFFNHMTGVTQIGRVLEFYRDFKNVGSNPTTCPGT